jgi:Cu/Zn superoxide dismutase
LSPGRALAIVGEANRTHRRVHDKEVTVPTRLAALATALLPSLAPTTPTTPRLDVVTANGPLADLRPQTADPTDGASASVLAVRVAGRTVTILHLRGLDRSVAHRTFGAHVHVGPCVPGNGAAAGPHFNIDVYRGINPPEVSSRTEIWLDFTVTRHGTGHAVSLVPFAVPPGAAASIVVHELPTDPAGMAGPRLACIGVPF